MLILAVVALAAALLLFASAALPVLSDRAPDAASGTTSMPTTTLRSLSPPSSVPPAVVSSLSLPEPQTTVDVATTSPSTTPAPSTAPTTLAASTSSTAPRAPTGQLAVGPIDTSAFPRVAFDVVIPGPLAAVQLHSNMVAVDGAPVDSVTAVDPRDVRAALVIDDRPTVGARVLVHLQGASVELVRNVGRGTEIALATPSGLASAFTPSPDANIGRIAAITAGAPAVTPLPGLLTSSIRALASSPTPDRHVVLLLGAGLDLTAEQLGSLEHAVTESGTRLHLIVPSSVEATAIASLAERSGGIVASSANIVASIDEVTAAIARRYRVVATMTSSRGEHSIAVTAKDLRYEARVRSM